LPPLDQVMSTADPATSVSEPLGDVTLIAGAAGAAWIVNAPSLWSVGSPSDASLTLTLQLVEGVFGTVHSKSPSFSVLAVTMLHVAPSLVYSIFTFPTVPPEAQVILHGIPGRSVCPPLGEVTDIDAGTGALDIVKTLSLWSV
jgi:hypothetical protein